MTNWLYRGKELNDEDIPKEAIGFVYIIRQLSTGEKYIGRKLLYKPVTKMVNGKKKKSKADSDWRTYWSSSPDLKEFIKLNGTTDFSREILTFCQSKGSILYNEELALYLVGALEADDWKNNNIRSKIYRSWIKREDSKNLRSVLKEMKLTN